MTAAPDEMHEQRAMTPWPLGLARRVAYPKLTVSLLVGSLALAYFAISGAWFPDRFSRHWSSSRQITGMALTFTLLPTYLAGFFIFTCAKTIEYVSEVRPLFLDPGAESLVAALNRVQPSRFAAATAAGVVLGCFNISWTVVSELGDSVYWPIDLSMIVGSMAVWIFTAQLIYSRAHNAFLLSRLGRHWIRVDLFALDRLEAFGRIGILDVLLVMGALALTPLQALDAEFRSYNYLFAFLVAVPAGLFLLASPMWGIHLRIRDARQRALAEVESRIAQVSRVPAGPALAELNDLLDRRSYLQSVHAWPMNLRGVSRVAFYFIIPPLAWIGAALAEMLVTALLHPS